jgi:hypothetical protein
MKVTSGILSEAQMAGELAALPEMLLGFGIRQVEAFFGFGCDGPMDELYKVALLAPNTIPSWVVSEGARIGFNMSRGDLYIEAVDKSFGMHFCHDSDIHVEGTSVEAVAILERRWRGLGFPGYVFVGEQWVSFSQVGPHNSLGDFPSTPGE